MKYVSLFSGIEAASVASESLGWEPVCFAELDEFPSAVLAHRYPDVPNVGDVTKVDWSTVAAPDVLAGGVPCQGYSRKGLQLGGFATSWGDKLRPPDHPIDAYEPVVAGMRAL